MAVPIPLPDLNLNLTAQSKAGGGGINGSMFGSISKSDFPFKPPSAVNFSGDGAMNQQMIIMASIALAGIILLKKKGK